MTEVHLETLRLKPTRRRWLLIGRAFDERHRLRGFTLCWWTGTLAVWVRPGKRPLCGDLEGDPDEGLTVECDRRKGHRGDHHAVVTWPQYVPPPPRDPNAPPRTGLFYKPEVWQQTLLAALQTRLIPVDTGRLRDSLTDEVPVLPPGWDAPFRRAPRARCPVWPVLGSEHVVNRDEEAPDGG